MTCPTTDATMGILHERFEDMVISRRCEVNWPPRSCDLTYLDSFLWDVLNWQVYGDKLPSTDALKVEETNTNTISQIKPDLCDRVFENCITWIPATVRSCNVHLNDFILHMQCHAWVFQI